MEEQTHKHIKEKLRRMGRVTTMGTNTSIVPFKPYNKIGECILFIIQNTKKGFITIPEISEFISANPKSVYKRLNIMFKNEITSSFIERIVKKKKDSKQIFFKPTKKMSGMNIEQLYTIIIRSKPKVKVKPEEIKEEVKITPQSEPEPYYELFNLIRMVNEKIEDGTLEVIIGLNKNGRYVKIGLTGINL
jgi:hypothetical protein